MKISELGGEFSLIKRLTGKNYRHPDIIKGVGDDCAVLRYTPDRHLLVTTDMMVEDVHFSCRWHTPFQIGKKLMEVNVSDILAMGGTPLWALVSVSITSGTEVEFMDELYRGLYSSAERHGVSVIGGDTTRGEALVMNLTVLGEVETSLVRFRSGAKPGDLLCVTGTLGRSQAGLKLLESGLALPMAENKNQSLETARPDLPSGLLAGYLEPRARLASEARTIARHAHAMIDVSDGLAGEVRHICQESGTGARINRSAIPVSPETREAARLLGKDPVEFALHGGEDFELVFTLPPDRLGLLKNTFSDFTVIGEILPPAEGIFLISSRGTEDPGKGYDHFNP